MRPLVIAEYSSCLKVRNGKLVLRLQGQKVEQEWAPGAFPYDTVVCDPMGGFVTFPALRWLADRGVVLTLLNFDGRPVLTALPDHPINGRDRIAQLKAYSNPQKRVEMAREILRAKVGREVPQDLRDLNRLRMWEAEIAARYWSDLGIVRDYPKARDPTNAAINYSFGLLESVTRRMIHRLGLEPSIGFLHVPRGPSDGKSAFVYDVMEPYRETAARVALAERPRRADYFVMFGGTVRLRQGFTQALARRFAKAFPEREMGEWLRRLTLRMALPPLSNLPGPQPSLPERP